MCIIMSQPFFVTIEACDLLEVGFKLCINENRMKDSSILIINDE